ncbi:hypothetical protein MMPV_009597 [Pyropia vietnamensis]
MEDAVARTPALTAAVLQAASPRRRRSRSVTVLTSSASASLNKSLRKLRLSTTLRKRPAAVDDCPLQPSSPAIAVVPTSLATGGETPLERRRSINAAMHGRLTRLPRHSLVTNSDDGAAPAVKAVAVTARATIPTQAGAAAKDDAAWRRQLTRAEYAVLRRKGTERPYSGQYDSFFPDEGHFVCAACTSPLYSAAAKFRAGCGWPAFEACYEGAVDAVPDGHRTEIVCVACRGHLGHVFTGERMTATNERHCVNSVSVKYRQGEAPTLPEGRAQRG